MGQLQILLEMCRVKLGSLQYAHTPLYQCSLRAYVLFKTFLKYGRKRNLYIEIRRQYSTTYHFRQEVFAVFLVFCKQKNIPFKIFYRQLIIIIFRRKWEITVIDHQYCFSRDQRDPSTKSIFIVSETRPLQKQVELKLLYKVRQLAYRIFRSASNSHNHQKLIWTPDRKR